MSFRPASSLPAEAPVEPPSGATPGPGRGTLTTGLLAAAGTLALQLLLALVAPGLAGFDKYPRAAELAAAGALSAERRIDFSPLYLALVEAAGRLFGDPRLPLVALQVGLLALAAGAVAARAGRHLSRPWALAAAALVAADLSLATYVRVLEPEIVQLACVAGCLALLSARRPGRTLLAGLLAAASLATRASLAPFLFAGVPFALLLELGRGRAWRRATLAFLAPVVLAGTLLQLRALALTGSFLASPMNPGTVFFEGNQPLSHGTSAVYPPLVLSLAGGAGREPDAAHQLYRDVARAGAGLPLTVLEVNRTWSARAWAMLRDHPAHTARRLAEKLRLTLQAAAPHDVQGAWRLARRLPLPAWPWALTGAAALVALMLARPYPARFRGARNGASGSGAAGPGGALRPLALELLLLANQLAVLLVFYVSARQRLLLLLALAPLAATAGARLTAAGRRATVPVLGIAALTLALLPTGAPQLDAERLRQGAIAADRAFREIETSGESLSPGERTRRSVDALAAAPWLVDLDRPAGLPLAEEALLTGIADRLGRAAPASEGRELDLAEIELRLDRTVDARRRLAALAASGARFNRGALGPSDPRILLARIDARAGDREAARHALDAALDAAPGDPFALAERYALAGDAADLDRLERYFGRLDARWLTGRAWLAQGRSREAAAALSEVTAALPAARAAWIDLAAALSASGRLEEGVAAYLHALHLALQPLQREREIVTLFRTWAEERPERTDAQVYALQILFQHGRWGEAATWLSARPALAGLPGVDAIARQLALAPAAAGEPPPFPIEPTPRSEEPSR